MTGKLAIINYRNHRGETFERRVNIYEFFWGSNEFYKEDQWLFRAWCFKRKDERVFACANVVEWKTTKACWVCDGGENEGYVCEHCDDSINKSRLQVHDVIRSRRTGETHIVERGSFGAGEMLCYRKGGETIYLIGDLWHDNFDIISRKKFE